MKNYKFGFSIAGGALLIATFITINILTSPQFQWSLFPVFAILWWPVSVYSYSRKSAMVMAVLGSTISIIFFVAVNLITSSQFPWSIFPVFSLLWWPIAVYMAGKKNILLMSILSTLLIVTFFVTVNLITWPSFIWSFFPVSVLLWWPLSVYCGLNKKYTLFSIIGSLLIIVFFFITDYITTPAIEWAFYVIIPILVWPSSLLLRRYFKIVTVLLVSGLILVAYYILLNIFVSPLYPWSIFVTYGILLIMVTSYFWYMNKGLLATLSSLIITAIFIPVFILFFDITEIWIFELVFVTISFLTCIHLYLKGKFISLARVISLTILLLVVYENIRYNSGHLWFLYAAFPILWPFVMTLFPKQARTFWFALLSAATGILYYGILNMLLSPGNLWFIYPAFALAWWPLATFYAKTKNPILFSISGSLITIIFFGGINLVTSPTVLWSVFPIFVLLWWPLSVSYNNKRKRILTEKK